MNEGGFSSSTPCAMITLACAALALVIHLPNFQLFFSYGYAARRTRILFGIKNKKIFQDISTDVKFISRACMKYAHMCIYAFDIIIVGISQASRNDLGSRFLTIESNDEENYSRICHRKMNENFALLWNYSLGLRHCRR